MKKIISANADKRIIEYMMDKGYEVELFGPLSNVSEPIMYHPDLIYTRLTDDYVFEGNPEKPGARYPDDVRYNACSTGKYFIHNLKYTDQELMCKAKALGLKPVHVKQGYSKCSIIPVDCDSIITYDEGIASNCENEGIRVLRVSPEGVMLPGYNRGFIGGASGKLDDEIIFNGNLLAHPDCEAIIGFVKSRGLKVKYFDSYPLTDIGSII